jgi:hypothetical protein
MLLPPPPLNEHGRLAVNAADIAGALVDGLTSACLVCDHSAIHWWPMPDGLYIPVHRGCTGRMAEHWRERIEAGDAEQPPADLPAAPRRGAYARRSTASGARLHPPRAKAAPSRSMGSPHFRPGMPLGAPWVIVVESHHGRLVFVHGDHEAHARKVLGYYEALAANGQPVTAGGATAVGAALLDPAGNVVDGWGEEFDLDAPSPWKAPERPHPVAVEKPGKRKRGPKAKTFD